MYTGGWEIGLCEHANGSPIDKAGPYLTMEEAAEAAAGRNEERQPLGYGHYSWYWARVGEMGPVVECRTER